MSGEKHFMLRPIVAALVLLSLWSFLISCANPNANSGSNQANYPFIGNWQGNGTDSEGNPFTFVAKVSHLRNNKYRMLILDKLDTLNEPMHIMGGVLENNKFSYTADEGLYEGGGTLSKDLFEGYYKGPVDGTYKMWRTNSKIETNEAPHRPDKPGSSTSSGVSSGIAP